MTEWINPYRLTKRGADTLNLIEERRLVGLTNTESARRPPTWKFVGGNPGSWSEIAFDSAQLAMMETGVEPEVDYVAVLLGAIPEVAA
jgi:hypothetical protein